jgi:hypothetical protein
LVIGVVLKETYFANLGNVKKMDPGAVIIDVTRRAGESMTHKCKSGNHAWLFKEDAEKCWNEFLGPEEPE